MIEFLISCNKVKIHDDSASKALVWAARRGYIEIVKWLLETGVNLKNEIKSMDCFCYVYGQYTCHCAGAGLIEALENRYFAIVTILLKANGNNDLPCKRLVDIALKHNRLDILLNNDISPPITDYMCGLLQNNVARGAMSMNCKKFIRSWENKRTKNAALACLTIEQGKRNENCPISILPSEILYHVYSFTLFFHHNTIQRKNFLTKIFKYNLGLFQSSAPLIQTEKQNPCMLPCP